MRYGRLCNHVFLQQLVLRSLGLDPNNRQPPSSSTNTLSDTGDKKRVGGQIVGKTPAVGIPVVVTVAPLTHKNIYPWGGKY
jgi:hypothetical protein